MKEFNFERCWRTEYEPAFEKVASLRDCRLVAQTLRDRLLVAQTKALAPKLSQDTNYLSVLVIAEKDQAELAALKERFDELTAEALAELSELVYWAGHLAPGKTELGSQLQNNGFYWKFQSLAVDSILRRNGGEALQQARVRRAAVHKKFYDHKEGTEFDNEELTEKYQELGGDVFEVVRVENINFRVEGNTLVRSHPFMIGIEHLMGDSGRMDMTQPCAFPGCCGSIEAHVSDRAMFLKLKQPIKKSAATLKLRQMGDKLNEDKIKIDGFAFVRTEGIEFLD